MFSKSLILPLLSLGLAFAWTGCQKQEQAKVAAHEAKVAAYHCPMHPQIVKDGPGACPICGMDLVAIESEPSSDENPSGQLSAPIVRLSTEMIKTLKIGTERISVRDSGGIFIPAKALVRTENRTRVVVALGGGRFQPRPVEIGEESADSVSILSGLEEGDEIVLSGQFLLDSESSLRASASSNKVK